MLSRRWALCGLVLLAAAAGVTEGQPPPTVPADGTQLEPDRTLVEVTVQPDGTAVWRVEYRMAFDDEGDRTAFTTVREEVDGNLSYAGAFARDMRQSVAAAEDDTGREMAVHNVTVEATEGRIPEAHGKLVYTFVWKGFAAVEDKRISVGDALSGLYLNADTTLLVTWKNGLSLADVHPQPSERREDELVWTGPAEFGSDGPSVVLDRSGVAGGATGRLPVAVPVPVFVAGAAIVLALLGVVVRRRRRPTEPAGEAGEEVAGEPDDATPPEELLSDEERVLTRLQERGGRMKQQELVTEMEWSETKTSEVVQRLRDDGQVEVYRIGRENVLALPGEMDV